VISALRAKTPFRHHLGTAAAFASSSVMNHCSLSHGYWKYSAKRIGFAGGAIDGQGKRNQHRR
jgi:hypothetical protein